jgi:hypothetical protein
MTDKFDVPLSPAHPGTFLPDPKAPMTATEVRRRQDLAEAEYRRQQDEKMDPMSVIKAQLAAQARNELAVRLASQLISQRMEWREIDAVIDFAVKCSDVFVKKLYGQK